MKNHIGDIGAVGLAGFLRSTNTLLRARYGMCNCCFRCMQCVTICCQHCSLECTIVIMMLFELPVISGIEIFLYLRCCNIKAELYTT